MLEIVQMVLGPVETNAYLAADAETGEAVVIDPAWDGEKIVAAAEKRGWRIAALWMTHAHFDHIAGTAAIVRSLPGPVPIALHPDDLPLWEAQGGAPFFGIRIEQAPLPDISLAHQQELRVGRHRFEVRHVPGHTPGHVAFYNKDDNLVFCGDVIFGGSIGRTDLPGGSMSALMNSIHTQIMTLPDNTRLLSGHGPETTVGFERLENPFLT